MPGFDFAAREFVDEFPTVADYSAGHRFAMDTDNMSSMPEINDFCRPRY